MNNPNESGRHIRYDIAASLVAGVVLVGASIQGRNLQSTAETPTPIVATATPTPDIVRVTYTTTTGGVCMVQIFPTTETGRQSRSTFCILPTPTPRPIFAGVSSTQRIIGREK